MKRALCILLALMTTFVLMTSVIFATEEAADTDTEVTAEQVIPADGEDAEAAENAEAEDAAPAEEENVPVQVLELTVNRDGSSSTTLTMPVPHDYEDQIDGIIEQYNGMGVATELIEDYQGFKAIKVTTERDSSQPCNVSTPGSESAAFDAWVVKGLFKDTTIMNATYDFSQGYYEEDEDIATIIIHLPSKAKIHNAEKVEGKTYTWTLKGAQSNSIRFVMEKMNLVGWIAWAIIICLLILLLLLLLSKKNKKGTDIVPEAFEDNLAEGLDDAQNAVENAVEDVADAVEDVKENVQDVVEDVVEKAEDVIDEIKPEE